MKKSPYFGYFRSRWPKILLVVILMGISTAGNFLETLFISDIVDKVQNVAFSEIVWLALISFGIEFVSCLASWISKRYTLQIKESVIKNLHLDLTKAFVNSTVESVFQKEPAEIAGKIGETKNFVDLVCGVFMASLSVISGIAAMLYIAFRAWQVTILLLIFLVVFMWMQVSLRKKLIRKGLNAKEVSDQVKQFVIEVVAAYADIKGQSLVEGLKEKFVKWHEYEVKENVEAEKLSQTNSFFTQEMVAVYKFVFLILTVFLLVEKEITYAEFLAMYMYKSSVQQAASGLLQIFKYDAMMEAAIQRMDGILNHTSLQKAHWGYENCVPNGDLSIKNVTVERGGKKVLDDLTCTIKKRSTVGIVGLSGCGKSTLLSVISRQIELDAGEIYIGDVPLSALSEHAFGKTVRIVLQSPTLFEQLTIGENLRAAKFDATEEMLWEALRLCNAESFVKECGGLNASVKKLSGGQKQRLVLARTILSGGEVILLDEITSALDAESQEAVMETVKAAKGKRTILMVAHRLTTLKDVDQILYMEDGRITHSGTFDYLYENVPQFRKLVDKG